MNQMCHRILVVGTGSIGERHVRCYLATERADVAICEPDADKRQAVAELYGIEQSFDDVETALQHPWDAVLIATPAHTHIPIALSAIEAGNHLILEKPLSTSMTDVDRLAELLQRHGKKAAVSYQMRTHPAVQQMKTVIESGRFGSPLQVYAVSGQDFAFYRPAYASTYFADHQTGGGAIQDAITHILNLSEFFVGPISRLCVDAQHQRLADVSVEDTVHVLTRHGSVMGSYAMNMYQHPNETSLTVVCEQGTVRFEVNNHRWRCMTDTEGDWEDWRHQFEDRDASYIQNAHVLLDYLESDSAPPCSLADARQTLRVNLAALRSVQTGSWQDLG